MIKFNYDVETDLLTDENVELILSTGGAVEKWLLRFVESENELYQRCIINAKCDFDRRDELKDSFNRAVEGKFYFLIENGYSNED